MTVSGGYRGRIAVVNGASAGVGYPSVWPFGMTVASCARNMSKIYRGGRLAVHLMCDGYFICCLSYKIIGIG